MKIKFSSNGFYCKANGQEVTYFSYQTPLLTLSYTEYDGTVQVEAIYIDTREFSQSTTKHQWLLYDMFPLLYPKPTNQEHVSKDEFEKLEYGEFEPT